MTADFAEVLKAKRIALGLTQRELASAVGTCQAHICKLERGECGPGARLLQRWAGALGYAVQLVEMPDDVRVFDDKDSTR